ncbi:outer membrane beta-barrel protein [Phyllobacterium sp. 628]|uniref:outer membrane beta-barrel protein n=1 Tax=Phyllobacterium sp. 628 TaxID=2718938 RepID=UPI0016626FFD|nr:outer membrane beta-barrel protein [Phyllobacterium sp. 628]QND53969.1 outer membrane beta-barrel protein [Phyllobacterium sp. 628]
MHHRQPRIEAPPGCGSFKSMIILCLSAGLMSGVAFTFHGTAFAQQAVPLRGSVDEDVLQTQQQSIPRRPLSRPAPTQPQQAVDTGEGIPSDPYQPVSPGALPDNDPGNPSGTGVPSNNGAPASGLTNSAGGLNTNAAAQPGAIPIPADRTTAANQRGRPGQTPARGGRATDGLTTGALDDTAGNPKEQRADKDNLPEPAIERRIIKPDPEPFAPLGIRAGIVTLRPSISQGIRATTNADGSSDGKSAVLSETRLRARATTDWARHSAFLDFDGTYDKSLSGEDYSAPDASLRGGFQLDLGERTTVTGEGGYRYRQEDASAPTTIVGTSNRPAVQELDANLGVRHEFGRFFGQLKGKVDHTTYGKADFSDGTSISQKDRDNTFASIALRGGFEMSPAIKPFAEVEIGKLMYDETEDSNGFRRSGLRTALRGGIEADFGEKLSGEFALGYLRQGIDDERLSDVDGVSVDGAIKWSPQRGTDVNLGLLTRVEGATAPNDSGSIFYEGRLGVKRQIRSNLSVNAELTASLRDNKDGSGLDKGFGVEVGTTYWFNRFLGLDVSARHRITRSEVDTRQTSESSVYMGLTLQR